MKSKLILLILLLLTLGTGALIFQYYSFVFAHHIKGEVIGIDRVTQPTTIIGPGSQIPPSQVFSFAIAIKDKKGEIFTSSSEDRQWAIVEKGQCVEAKFFPYAPWQFEKAGTYYGARLLKIFPCESSH